MLAFWTINTFRRDDYRHVGLEDHLAFIERHVEQAGDLSPTSTDLKWAYDVEEAVLLLELARHCARRAHRNFDLEAFIKYGLVHNQYMDKERMAEVLREALGRGMPRADVLNALQDNPYHHDTYKMLRDGPEVKQPEED
jgi:hypothetical protein